MGGVGRTTGDTSNPKGETVEDTRHPHPHIDPRQPRDGAQPGANPPVFVWKPPELSVPCRLRVARDAAFADVCLDLDGLRESAFLPERAFAPGRYFWQWSAERAASEVFSFEITPDAVVLEVPPADEWLRRFPTGHPRIYVSRDELPALRQSRLGPRSDLWEPLGRTADALLAESHDLPEPAFLPDWGRDYQQAFDAWYRILVDSRRFVQGALTLALAYLASGDRTYARAACERLSSVSQWDPEGSSHIEHNDEAHMSVIQHGPLACDWVWDEFTEEERRAVVAQFRRRGQITYEHMHDRGCYGVTRFDNHAGREIVFLALIALVFHEEIPEARQWLDWLRPVLCGIWPIWATDDGAWVQGPAYALYYVEIMTNFATALKHGANVALYRRPFWRNHARWRQWCVPAYAEWIGFGDGRDASPESLLAAADLVELIDRESEADEFATYVAELRAEAARKPVPARDDHHAVSPQSYLSPITEETGRAPDVHDLLRTFPGGGWAAIRTARHDPQHDIALLFRSSPYGSISHAHANNNDFIVHVAGKAMAIPSGYYDGYGSDHHVHWVWHTKSHNCITLSDAPQIMQSCDSTGAIEAPFEDERIVYLRGNADASYSDRADRCRRHLLFLKEHSCFVLIDEFRANPAICSALQWNIHSWSPFQVDEEGRSFLLERDGSSLQGHFLYHANSFFSLSEGFDPPPFRTKPSADWLQQYHLRFTTSGLDTRRSLGVVLSLGHASLRRAEVVAERAGAAEVAHIGGDLVMVNQAELMEYGDLRSDALALFVVKGRQYELRDEGIR